MSVTTGTIQQHDIGSPPLEEPNPSHGGRVQKGRPEKEAVTLA